MTSPGWNPTNRSGLRFPGRIRLSAKPNERRGIALDGHPLRILSSRHAVARTKVQLGQDHTPCDVHQSENRGSARHLQLLALNSTRPTFSLDYFSWPRTLRHST